MSSMSSISPVQKFPPEIFTHIFRFGAQMDSPDPPDMSPDRHWRASAKHLRVYVEVCRAWWDGGIALMYRSVSVTDYTALSILAKALKSGNSARGSVCYGKFVREFAYRIPCFDADDTGILGQEEISKTIELLTRVLSACPNVTTIRHRLHCDTVDGAGDIMDTYDDCTGRNAFPTDHYNINSLLAPAISCTYLVFENKEKLSAPELFLGFSSLPRLRTLEVELYALEPSCKSVHPSTPLLFPSMGSLTFTLHLGPTTETTLIFLAEEIQLPSLRVWNIKVDPYLNDEPFFAARPLELFRDLCRRQGASVEELELNIYSEFMEECETIYDEEDTPSPKRSNLDDILQAFPRLSRLSLTPARFSVRTQTAPTLAPDVHVVEFLLPEVSLDCYRRVILETYVALLNHLPALADSKVFPALHTVRFKSETILSPPLDWGRFLEELIPLVEALLARGIRLQDHASHDINATAFKFQPPPKQEPPAGDNDLANLLTAILARS